MSERERERDRGYMDGMGWTGEAPVQRGAGIDSRRRIDRPLWTDLSSAVPHGRSTSSVY